MAINVITIYYLKIVSIVLQGLMTSYHIVLQISRLSEGSTGQIFATSSVIYQMKMWGL